MTHDELYQQRLSEFTWAAMTYQDIAERAVSLEELVLDMWEFFCVVPEDEPHVFKEELEFSVEVWRRMCELGIEVKR